MPELFFQPLFVAALGLAAMIAFSARLISRVRRWRGGSFSDQPTHHELLTKFREIHDRGGLSDDEYRTIKTKLATQIDAELKDADDAT